MALKGTLKDFSISDIFQLVSQQTKSGSLYVRQEEKEAHIVFDAGKVVLGTFKKSDEDFLLGTMLLRAGLITDDQLAAAVESQKISMRSLGDILKTSGIISAQTLSEFISLQLKEVLFRIFQWKDGLYEFVPEQIRYNKAIIRAQTAEALLMDGFRMLDEWPPVREKTGSAESIFKFVGESAILDAPLRSEDEEGASDRLTGVEKRVLELFDGRRSLQEIIYRSRLGTFDTYRITAGFLDRGWIIKTDELGVTRIDTKHLYAKSLSFSDWVVSSIWPLMGVFVVTLLFPFLAFQVPSAFSAHFGRRDAAGRTIYGERMTFQQWARTGAESRVRERLELYRVEHGRYPAALEDLDPSPLLQGWIYQVDSEKFTLMDERSFR